MKMTSQLYQLTGNDELCPNCGSRVIPEEPQCEPGDKAHVYAMCWCKNCDSSWTAVYTLSGYENLEEYEDFEEEGA